MQQISGKTPHDMVLVSCRVWNVTNANRQQISFVKTVKAKDNIFYSAAASINALTCFQVTLVLWSQHQHTQFGDWRDIYRENQHI